MIVNHLKVLRDRTLVATAKFCLRGIALDIGFRFTDAAREHVKCQLVARKRGQSAMTPPVGIIEGEAIPVSGSNVEWMLHSTQSASPLSASADSEEGRSGFL